jgi:hypothetical protein
MSRDTVLRYVVRYVAWIRGGFIVPRAQRTSVLTPRVQRRKVSRVAAERPALWSSVPHLVAQGLTSQQMAQRLVISPPTVNAPRPRMGDPCAVTSGVGRWRASSPGGVTFADWSSAMSALRSTTWASSTWVASSFCFGRRYEIATSGPRYGTELLPMNSRAKKRNGSRSSTSGKPRITSWTPAASNSSSRGRMASGVPINAPA